MAAAAQRERDALTEVFEAPAENYTRPVPDLDREAESCSAEIESKGLGEAVIQL